jgi:nucleoside-diphosphate-sugar epimerase
LKNISILGSGWLGFDLAKELKKDYSIKLCTRTRDKYEILKKDFDSYILDIENLQNYDKAFFDSDLLIINIPCKNIDAYKNLVNILDLSPLSKVIFISSTAVYKNTNEMINEDDNNVLEDNTWIHIEKLFTQNKNFEANILRFAGLIGYDRNIVKHFQNKEVKNSNSPVNMIHKDDCINIIKNVIVSNLSTDIFNCCSSSHPTKKEFYTYSAKNSGYDIPKFDENKVEYKIIDNSKLIKKLAYKYIHDNLLEIEFEKI